MVETKKQKQVRVDNWAKFCHQRFQTFFKNSTYCDLTLEFQDNRKLKVHRILMCVCTEYFEEYFDYLKQINQDKKSDVIVMPAALQADVVIPIINFMYTGKLEYKIANFEKLYNASKLMNMSLLTKLLEAQKQTLTPTSEAKKSQSKPGLTPVKKLKLSQSSSTSKSSAQTVSSLSHSTTTKTYPVKTCVNSQLVNKEKVSDSQLPKSTTFSKKATSSNEGHKNLECDAVIDITEDLTSDESSDETKQILIEHKDIIPTTSFDKFQFQKYLNRMPEIDSIKVEPINVELSNQTTPMLIDENDIIMPNSSFDEPQFPSDMNTMPKVNSIKTEPESSNKSTPIVIDEIDVMPSTSFDKPEFLNDLNILPKKENLEVEDMIDCIKEEAICIEENEFIKNEVSDMEDDFSDEDCFDDFDRDIRLEATPSTSVQDSSNEETFSSEDSDCVEDAASYRMCETISNDHLSRRPPLHLEIETQSSTKKSIKIVDVNIPNVDDFIKEKILSQPPGSILRNRMIEILRLSKMKSEEKLQTRNRYSRGRLVQCKNCSSHYFSKSYWDHLNKCCPSLNTDKRKDAVLSVPNIPKFLIKKDPLITAFILHRLEIYKDPVWRISRISSQLTHILSEFRKTSSDVTDFFSLLRPKNFNGIQEIIVRCRNEGLTSPAYIFDNMNTYIKDCCNIAISKILEGKYTSPQMSSADLHTELKQFINLWNGNVSKKPKKDVIGITNSRHSALSLKIADLKVLMSYLIQKGNQAASKLLHSDDIVAYETLLETVYLRIVLLNKHTPRKVVSILHYTYEANLKDIKNQTHHNFTEVEKILLENFEGYITNDTILVSKEIHDHIQILLRHRSKFYNGNIYLFGNTYNSIHVSGQDISYKYATESGADKLRIITIDKLRNHLCTLTHLILMSENKLQKIVDSLGIVGQSCRLSDDINLVKIAKMLILMDQKFVPKCKGKTLEEIEVDKIETLL